ncbi:serine/arginine repetitive matrix protein 3 isoform X2 [Anguilla anguilla]|uniref:serine/arginine repetitive matrix protein 3 isoform X2 n=1 Tax=Anguilla anguilla TaxID=7936 RepID=UPI0015A96DF8|nr:serine/arginine repetitive matrix protein 3 isoform X2 [Anguilla anguilla]
MYDGARVPSPQDSANGFPQPGASGGRPKSDGEEEPKPEPVLVKKAHREILDHERKRRVELKCMELQEMMEEQGYSEEEIRQKVGTFRQMLMEKEGVITREGSQGRPVVNHCCEGQGEEHAEAEGYVAGCDCYGDCYDRESACHTDYRTKRKSSSSPSPPPKKRKKKRSGRRRSRFDSASPSRKEKKKKSGKKHKRDRSASGARKKRRYRSGSQKNKHKEKNKQRKRSPADSPGRRSHRRGSCSSRSASLSSTGSLSKSPSRPSSKHRADGHKACPSASARSASPSPGHAPSPAAVWQNGHRDGPRNGRDSGDKAQDAMRSSAGLAGARASLSPHPKGAKAQDASGTSPGVPPGVAASGDDHRQGAKRSPSPPPVKRRSRQRAPGRSSHSPARSSDSAHSQHDLPVNKRNKSSQQKKTRGARSSKRRHRNRTQARHRSSSASPTRRGRRASGRKKSSSHSLRQRSSSWSSAPSGSRSRSREHGSKAKSPHSRQNQSREKDSAHHTDSESRARRRSRSYSPIRKRRRDSPSFMEARRITRCPEDYRERNSTELQARLPW